MVNPLPVLQIDGATLTVVTTTATDGTPVLYDDRPTVIGRMTVDWGRTDQWTQPPPAVLTLTVWEPATLAATWLSKIMAGTALRRPCKLKWNKPSGTNPGDKIIFDGFTTNVDVEASRERTTRGMVDGWLVRIQATDRSGFIANQVWGAGVLPSETMQARAVRIRDAAAPSTGIRQFYFESRFTSGTVTALDVTDKTVLDTTTGMYTSFADQWCYNSARNVVIRIPGGSNFADYTLKLGVSTGDNAIRLYPPAWVDPTGTEAPIDQEGYRPGYIGACDVSAPVTLSANSIHNITDVTVNWYDAPNSQNWQSSLNVRASNPLTRLAFDSWYNNGTYIDPILADVKDTCLKEGARPVHPTVTWDTRITGDVPDYSTFENLTITAQTIRMVCLAGSPFSAATGYAPVWHPCGGVVAYENGKWILAVNLSPTTMPLPAGHTPITPATINQSITLGNPNSWYIDPSITPFDLYYVPNDANVYAYN